WMLRLSRAGAVDVALCRTADVDALVQDHPEADWERLRRVPKGRRSQLAALKPAPAVRRVPRPGDGRGTPVCRVLRWGRVGAKYALPL
ncbi:hypothetical protein ACIRUZ_18235, partial [Streptomyces sp. NPDC101145]